MTSMRTVTVGFLMWTATIALAQESDAPTVRFRHDAEIVTELFNVVNVNPRDVVAMIEEVGLQLRASTVGDSRVLVRGEPADVEQFRSLLAEQIDVPSASAENAGGTHFIRLRQHPSKSLMKLLRSIGSQLTTHVAYDSASRMLVVQGPEPEVRRIAEVLERFNQPVRSLTIHFYFIRATIGGEADAEKHELPKALTPVAETMAANGFGDLGLLATVMVTADEGREFEQYSKLRTSDDEGAVDELVFRVAGVAYVRSGAGEEVAQVEIEAYVRGEYEADDDEGETNFRMETAVVNKLGGYVILAAGPSSTSEGDAIALVVRVTQN